MNSEEKDIAITGIACRFPNADTKEAFWQNLITGADCLQEIPLSRFNWRSFLAKCGNPDMKSAGGFINNVESFDADFFGIPHKEAAAMDPQQRILLELTWACFEDAGIARAQWAGKKTGVFIGATNFDYKELQEDKLLEETDIYYATATAPAVIANRISYYFDLKGPSVSIDTACSSSLNAIHLAVQSLLSGECETSLAGGINLLLSPTRYASLIQMGILSPGGSCKTFDDSADGYIRSEGAGMILLKPLAAALRDGDPVYGVIRGTAVNHSGKTYTLTYPSADAQAAVMSEAMEKGGIDPATVSYIELHGTGTPKGDPIEFDGLCKAFGETPAHNYCGLGAVKAGIGHLEAAAGIAGLVKVILSMQHKCLPPLVHFTALNHRISLENTPFYIVDQPMDWPVLQEGLPRRAGISSFGFGGTNAHVVVEEFATTKTNATGHPVVIVLSAKNAARLELKQQQLLQFLSEDVNLDQLAYTLQVGRVAMESRWAVVVNSLEELKQALNGGMPDLLPMIGNVTHALNEKDYQLLAGLWMAGEEVAWHELYPAGVPARINLPAYPFEYNKFWLAEEAIPEAVVLPVVETIIVSGDILEELSSLLKESLFLETTIGPDNKFVDHGMDSITSVEYIKSINKHFNTNLSATDLYDHPTLNRLSAYVKTKLSDVPPVTVTLDTDKGYGYVVASIQDVRNTVLAPFATAAPAAREVQIQVMASAINFPDVMCVKGLYPTQPAYPFVPGFEAAGIVTAVGSEVRDFRTGDEVMGLTGQQMGGHGNYVNLPAATIVKKPSFLSFEEACSLPVIFLTSWYALQQANLKAGEHILIQTAAGGVGLMAAQLSQLQGAEITGTSGNEEKLALLKSIGIKNSINYKAPDFIAQAKRIAAKGFDVVLNTLSGAMIQAGLDLLSPGGRYIELAVHGLRAGGKLDLSGLTQNQQLHSVDLRRLMTSLPVKEILKTMCELLEQHKIFPVISRTYPIHEIGAAMGYVESGRHIGKVVLSHTAAAMSDHTLELKQVLQQQLAAVPVSSSHRKTDIAIVGMAGRVPGANDINSFWNNLRDGVNSVREVPDSRWEKKDYFDADPAAQGKSYSKWMGMLDDIAAFDPLFFNISPMEASLMDPQQRLFLEESWKAIEDAGYAARQLSDEHCGVFIGVTQGDYEHGMIAGSLHENAYRLTGNSSAILSARISYLLNLKGPCLSIDTACSSSLVAIAQACDSLLLGNCSLALAGGVSVRTTPVLHVMMSKAGMLSPDGQCYTFDQRANGFVPAEAVGVLILKKLDDAIAAGDRIHGVIKGWGINQDGATNGITAPSKDSQVALIKGVYDRFEIDPATISYVEAHGTGTKLGDPIEMSALQESFRSYTNKVGFCGVGSVKSNIGHALTAAGMPGLFKLLLSFKHGQLPASLHCRQVNEHINMAGSPFFVTDQLQEWTADVRRAAISSFGFSGTNAHLVLEEYKEVLNKTQHSQGPAVIVLSAKDEDRLKEKVTQLLTYLKNTTTDLYDIAYTLQEGREPMEVRLAVEVNSITQLMAYLEGTATAVLTQPLAQQWVKGATVDWSALYHGSKPRKVSVPHYPFARKHCWFNTPAPKAPVVVMQGSLSDELCEALCLSAEGLDPHLHFKEMGLDDILAGEFISKINKRFHSTITVKTLMELGTLERLTAFLEQQPPALLQLLPIGSATVTITQQVPDEQINLLTPTEVFPQQVEKKSHDKEGSPAKLRRMLLAKKEQLSGQ